MPESKPGIIRVPLDFEYKGDRNYIHGTSAYQSVTDYLSEAFPERVAGSFRMVIHAFAKSRCDFVYTLDSGPVSKPEAGVIELSTSTGIHGWLVESGDEVVDRLPFPEDQIIDQCRTGDDRSVAMISRVPFHPIEILVAITKHLHQQEYPEASGKWVFTRLDLDRLLTDGDCGKLGVQIQKSIGTRLTQSAVLSDGEPIGKIYFSMVSEWPE
ncbi:MAG: hypothetical protein RQ867_02455 [Mariprofundaceae bacterium]|nr:hypothetical protein [Mariprofundaceae bacterium]